MFGSTSSLIPHQVKSAPNLASHVTGEESSCAKLCRGINDVKNAPIFEFHQVDLDACVEDDVGVRQRKSVARRASVTR